MGSVKEVKHNHKTAKATRAAQAWGANVHTCREAQTRRNRVFQARHTNLGQPGMRCGDITWRSLAATGSYASALLEVREIGAADDKQRLQEQQCCQVPQGPGESLRALALRR